MTKMSKQKKNNCTLTESFQTEKCSQFATNYQIQNFLFQATS